MLAWLSVWSEVQTCMWPSWCHCHSLSLAPVKSRLVLPFWYWLTRVVPEKGPLNVCVYSDVAWKFYMSEISQMSHACLWQWKLCDCLFLQICIRMAYNELILSHLYRCWRYHLHFFSDSYFWYHKFYILYINRQWCIFHVLMNSFSLIIAGLQWIMCIWLLSIWEYSWLLNMLQSLWVALPISH